MSNEKWQNHVAEICTTKDGKKYIKFKKACALKFKNSIFVESYKSFLDKMLDMGFFDQEKYDRMSLVDINEDGGWVSHALHLPPQEDKAESPKPQGKWVNNAIEVRNTAQNKPYIHVNFDLNMEPDDVIFLEKATDVIDAQLAKGLIDEKTAEERRNKLLIRDEKGKLTTTPWLLYRGTIPPKEKKKGDF